MLVIRTSDGEVRWMEVRDWLNRASDNGKKPVRQIVFEGERFDVMSIRGWRDLMLQSLRDSLETQALQIRMQTFDCLQLRNYRRIRLIRLFAESCWSF